MSTEPFRPSNGDEGIFFMAEFCDNCRRNNDEKEHYCSILTRAFAYDDDDPRFPKQWIRIDGEPTCTSFSDRRVPLNRKPGIHRAPKPTTLQPLMEGLA